MNTVIHTPTSLPEPVSGALHLILAPRALRSQMMTGFCARLAVRGTVWVFDGGNSFAGYALARQVRRLTGDLPAVLQRVRLGRAFTCYQAAALVFQETPPGAPVLALDLLSTFLDETVALSERLRLLGDTLGQLRRISRQAPVVISGEVPGPEHPAELLDCLVKHADQTWRFEPQSEPSQLSFF